VAAGELARRARESGATEERAYDLPEVSILLSGAMRELSPKQRASVALHDYAGYTSSVNERANHVSRMSVRWLAVAHDTDAPSQRTSMPIRDTLLRWPHLDSFLV
jgi:hypothetical protein